METLKIIVADDQPVFRIGLELIIKKINKSFNVFHAANGCEILEIIKCHLIDIVFIDTCIPGMNCIEITCRIKQSNPDVKIIALSCMSEKYDVLRMFKAGANGYLLKNASLDKIENAFKTIIKGENYFTDEIKCFFTANKKYILSKINLFREELTKRENDILKLICSQFTTKEISEKLHLSEKTIEVHRSHIMEKTHSKNMIGLALYAIERELINFDTE
jgi:DNA-binding NarL/FixJ family response regulator